MTTPLSELYLKACEFKGLARDIKVKGMSPAEGAAFRERERTKPLDAKVADLIRAAESKLWIGECRCDGAWLSRGLHQSNSYCGEMDEMKEALAALRKELSRGK